MGKQEKDSQENGGLKRALALLSQKPSVSFREIECVLREIGDRSIPVAQLRELMQLISDQMSYWEAEWYFSPEHSPNYDAKSEKEGWEILWEACFNMIVKLLPDSGDAITEEHNLTMLQHSMLRRIKYNETKPVAKITTSMLSKAAICLNKFGLRGIAQRMYIASLYPKGTMGRAS